MDQSVKTGKVKFFDSTKNYGFIASSEADYFFHATGTLSPVVKDDTVSFVLEEGKRGLRAIDVQKI